MHLRRLRLLIQADDNLFRVCGKKTHSHGIIILKPGLPRQPSFDASV